jgi:hypothetical protein
VPRTKDPKKRAIRFCGECGYELAPDNDGTCPMCRRFEQLRLDFTVPRPSDRAAHRGEARDTNVSAAPDEWPPPVAEYRAMLAERRIRSTPADQSRGRVIRTAGLTQMRVPPAPGSAGAADDAVLEPPVHPQPPVQEPSPTSPKEAKGRKVKDGGHRAARARARSLPAAEVSGPPATPSSSGAPTSADLPATDNSEAAPIGLEAQSIVAAAPEWVPQPTPRQVARPFTQAVPVRRESRSRAAAMWPSLSTVAIVAASVFIGAAVPLLLSLL